MSPREDEEDPIPDIAKKVIFQKIYVSPNETSKKTSKKKSTKAKSPKSPKSLVSESVSK